MYMGLTRTRRSGTGRCRLTDEMQGRNRFKNAPFLELNEREFLVMIPWLGTQAVLASHQLHPKHANYAQEACGSHVPSARTGGLGLGTCARERFHLSSSGNETSRTSPAWQADKRSRTHTQPSSSCALTHYDEARKPLGGVEECNCDRTEKWLPETKEKEKRAGRITVKGREVRSFES